MAIIRTVISDEWGEIAQFSIEGASDVGAGIRHQFKPRPGQQHLVVVVADAPVQIRQVLINGQEARRVETNAGVRFVAQVGQLGRDGVVDVVISLNPVSESATVHLGLFARLRGQVKGAFHTAVAKFSDKCFVCHSLVRMGISVATGGTDLVGEALERALDAAESALDEFVNDTLLDDILGVLRNAANPARLVAREVCLELGYCT